MKTDDLIAMLSTNVERVNQRRVTQTITMAVAVGAAASVGLMLITFGVRSDLKEAEAWAFLAMKLGFAAGIVALSTAFLVKAAHPGGGRKTPIVVLALPFILMVLLSGISVAQAPSSHWSRMIVGDQWLECLVSIPVIAIVPFAVVVYAVRKLAPTNLDLAGALAGLVAGGISAAGYALHCTGDSFPFVTLWYGGTLALCTLAGATLGPRLLRW
jgi:hypothetical protein